jgi:hypothetical protein
MEPTVEKNFSPDLKVVEAVNSLRYNWLLLLAGLLILAFFGWMLAILLLYQRHNWGFWYSIMALVLALVIYLMWETTVAAARGIHQRLHLKRHGRAVKATVVGHEADERNEEDVYLIYYQFRPDFVVRYQDNTTKRRWFHVPTGNQISVLYLLDNPEVTAVVEG